MNLIKTNRKLDNLVATSSTCCLELRLTVMEFISIVMEKHIATNNEDEKGLLTDKVIELQNLYNEIKKLRCGRKKNNAVAMQEFIYRLKVVSNFPGYENSSTLHMKSTGS